ncbi:MAG TPA: putative PEP-binding protein, partial [Devosiaceae bacterium]|nr:putative PEP-binding protein [Devosiaceae bacterium]
QAFVAGDMHQFLSRNASTGALGPAALPGAPESPPGFGARAAELCALIDVEAGAHMACLVAGTGDGLYFLSARPVQVGAMALLEAARDRVERGIWTPREAVGRIDAGQLPQLLHPRLTERAAADPIASGLGVSPGAASGEIVFTPEDAARSRARGRHCILVVQETGPADIEGMKAATGILTARGGMTSHAAVVARITGKPCVAGVRTLEIDPEDMRCRIGETEFRAGDKITIEGTEGNIFSGALPLSRPQIGGAIGKLLDWADGSRTIAVRTNVETVEAARTALSFGAEGIGLARSEHMFFSAERMVALRRLILSESEQDRTAALKGLVDYQAGDYAALFAVMPGRPVTVRLFDPPLHEFLPRTDDDTEETAASLGLTPKALRARLERLEEINPMLGHRGCRLAISYPEVLDMQVRALIAGMRSARRMSDAPLHLEIMVPFVSSAREVIWIRAKVMALLEQARIASEPGMTIEFGTMIELPRAALRAADIARSVDFFSFGTNDLTQTTFGISRDDAPAFLASYRRKAIFDYDPFVTIDRTGVGELIELAISRGKAANPNLKIGICGEHAGDPLSLEYFASLAIDYVSCSPYRVPVARLVLAQAAAG